MFVRSVIKRSHFGAAFEATFESGHEVLEVVRQKKRKEMSSLNTEERKRRSDVLLKL